MIRLLLKQCAFVCLLAISASASAQESYFVDGFHGGVYGHYPVPWYTQFMVDQLQSNPEWCIGLEIEPETWDTVAVRTPEAYKLFRDLVNDGTRVEYTNPSYAQSYLYPIAGESIIRQFQYGMRKLHAHFPQAVFTTYSVEEPCFTTCLPQILSQLGFRYAVLKCPNTCWGGYSEPFGGELVNWIGPDGTQMLTVPRYECEALQSNSVWQTTAWGNSREYLSACRQAGIKHPVGMCYQDAGWRNGPWLGKRRQSKYVLWTDYIDNIADHSVATDYHMTQEGVRAALVWGSQVMQRIGRQVRNAENRLLDAERMAVMAFVVKGWRPDQSSIDEAWRTLMLAQHHDSWIVPYNRLNRRGTWADNIALWTAATCKRADSVVDASVAVRSVADVTKAMVVNTTGNSRREVVGIKTTDGSICYIPVSVDGFGYTTVDVNAINQPSAKPHVKMKKNIATIENNCYRLVFDLKRGGILTSLYDKQQRREMVDQKSSFAFGELRGYFERYARFCSSVESEAQLTVMTDNAYVQRFSITGKIAGNQFEQIYTLKADEPIIDVELTIDWDRNLQIGNHFKRSKDDKTVAFYNTKYALNLILPASIHQPRLWKNAPFDVCESHADSTFFDTWTDIRHNIIHSWIDISDDQTGMALFTDHTTSYSFSKDYPLALTVQYSGPGLWGRNHTITEATRLRYALVPHRGKWDEAGISHINERWNHPLEVVDGANGGSLTLFTLDGTGYVLSACIVEGNDILLRLFNADGNAEPHDIPLRTAAKEICEVDLNGNVLRSIPIVDEKIRVQMPRYGIRTYRIKKYD